MKKRIFLFLTMAILLACAFAISISATTAIPEFTDVIDVTKVGDGVISPIDTSALASQVQGDNSSRVLLMDENGNYATYLTKYITKLNGGYNDDYHFVPYFDDLNIATGKLYDVTSIICIEIPEGTLRMSTTYSKTNTWTNVMYIKAPSTLNTYRSNCLQGCSKIKVLDVSKANITNAGKEFFTNNASIEKIIFPASCTDLGQWSLHGDRALECVYVPAAVETTNSLINGSTGSGKFVFFYAGDIKADTQHTALYTALNNANIVELKWDSANTDSYYIDLAKTEGKIYIVYDYSECEAFYDGIHDYQGTGDCKDGLVCDVCEDKIAGKAEHTYYETLVYTSFVANGVYSYGCSNEGCVNYDVEETTNPIFTAKGYSNSETGIAGGYTVDIPAYNRYKDITGKTITFGVMMINPSYLENVDSFFNGTNVNIDGTKGYIKVDMTNVTYKDFAYTINGFVGDLKELNLVISAFAYVEGEDVEFIQDQTTACASKKVTKSDATLYTVTFNSVEAKAGLKIADLGEYTVPTKEN